MTYDILGQAALNYFPCRYGTSKLLFRGPRRRLQGEYVAYLGGAETYGRFIETPFPMQIEQDAGIKSVNLGCPNVGLDAYLGDRGLIDICANARATVIQVMGAQNMSNRFYAVHPRRNDRFLRASSQLEHLYPDVDFADVNFTRHLLLTMDKSGPERFGEVRQELKSAWVLRMRDLIAQIRGKVVLLWLADHRPEDPACDKVNGAEPMFVDRAMLDSLSDLVSATVEVVATPAETRAGLGEMVFSEMELATAKNMAGPVVHRRVAAKLAGVLAPLV